MREISFRVWDKFQKKYIFTDFHVIGEVTVFGGIESVIEETWKQRSKKLGYTTTIESWDDFIIEQFTGLRDKNGVKIFESDIVSNEKDKGVVFWHDTRAMFSVDNSETDIAPMDDWNEFEVIGNIYENPELLDGKEK